VVSVLVAVAIVPSAPLLVPELAGAAAAETVDMREAALRAAAALPQRWVALGVGPRDQIWDSVAGTFAGYGVEVGVTLSPDTGAVAELPLCALIAGWIRGQVRPDARVEVRVSSTALPTPEALARGRALRADLDSAAEPVGVLVVADGCRTLTPAAPGGHDPASVAVQAGLDDALAGGDTTALQALPDTVVGRVAFAVLAGLAEPGPHGTKELYRGAPFGVGYHAGVWQP
jgi:hypothetical protein